MAWFERRAKGDRPHGSAVVPPPRSAMPTVTPERAMSLAAVYRAVSIIETSIRSLPIIVRRGNDPVQSRLAARPDVESTSQEFWGQSAVSLAMYGECFWLLSRSGYDDAVVNCKVVKWSDVAINEATDGRKQYYYKGRPTRDLKHLRLSTKPGEYRGYGPIQAASADFAAILALREYTDAYYRVGQPLGTLSSDQVLNQATADAYRETWEKTISQRTIAVLGSGMQYQPLFADAVQAQLTDANRAAITTVARAFGIPPQLLAAGIEGSSLSYVNGESLMLAFLQTGLAQFLVTLESNFSDLLPRGQEARFKLDALLRADLATRVQAYSGLAALGAITPEEIRLSEGFTPLPAGASTIAPQTQTDGSPV